MRRASAIAAAAAALAATPAAAAPPSPGVLVPGKTLGELALGATKARVESEWGLAYGVCRTCSPETWFFNYYAFRPQGAAVVFDAKGRAQALLTLWAPDGWRTAQGLRMDEPVASVTAVYGPLDRTECEGYYALTLPARRAVTAFYVWRERVWGFGLLRRGARVCR